MTARPPHDSATGHPAIEDAAESAEPGQESAAESSRPRPRPSPTSRARRVAAAPEGLRRPSPRPAPAPAAGQASAPAADQPSAPAAEQPSAPAAGQAPEADTLDSPPAELVSRQPTAADRARRVPAWLVAALAVLALALAGLDGWLLTSQPAPGSATERDQALSTAKTAVPLILSYDYRKFDADVTAAKARLTGRAVTDYVQAMTSTIKPTATKVQAVVRAQTDGAGVEAVSGDGSQVTVVVFGEQKVTNTALKAPRTDLFRVRVTLDRVQGQWLVSKFDQI